MKRIILLCLLPSITGLSAAPADSTVRVRQDMLDSAGACAADTAAAVPTLKERNRNLFERLFKSTPKKKKVISEKMASAGKAVKNPDRSHKAIHDVSYAHLEAVRHCYCRRLNIKPDLKGEMVITFRILPSGKIKDLKVIKDSVRDEKMRRCVLNRIRTFRFKKIPKKQGDVTVAYPFRFFPR